MAEVFLCLAITYHFQWFFFGMNVLDTPEKIATAGSARLWMTVQLGPKSIKEIAGALHKLGFIDNPDKWLEGLRCTVGMLSQILYEKS